MITARRSQRDVPAAVAVMRRWGEERDWRGYDPYDGLSSPAANWLSLGSPLGRRLLTQAVKLSPVNLRPALRIQPELNAKAVALVASAYARLAAAEGDEEAAASAARWLDWLVENHAGGDSGMAWGYHFDVQTRVFSYPRGAPNTIATSFCAQALLDGCELLESDRWHEPARRAAAFLADEMLEDGEAPYFRYLVGERALIHNANLLACAVLARTAHVVEDKSLDDVAASAMHTTLVAQNEDGSWPYGEAAGQAWVDNFHTGYVLESLAACERLADDVQERLERGIAYWQSALFLSDGTPKYFPDSTYPIDAHCYAQGIETWIACASWHPDARARASALADLLIERMLDSKGHVHFQQRRLWTNKVPFVRWTTAPSFRGLAGLMLLDARRSTGER